MRFIVALCILALAVQLSEGCKCEAGWTSFGDSCYYVSQSQLYSYTDAKALCELTGASLVTIDDAKENMFIKEFICGNYLWIGLTDIGHEGHFEWDSEVETTHRNWNSGQPDNYGQSEHCVHLLSDPVGKWNDIKCSTQMGFICEKKEENCHGVPVGVESKLIPDSQITASSNYNTVHMSHQGRLNWCQSGYSCSWCAQQNIVGQWLQINLGYPRKVTEVATQGRSGAAQWVTSYKLSYGDGSSWTYVHDRHGHSATFSANSDQNTVVYHVLNDDQVFTARYVRFVVQSWYGHISMRVEVYACK
ncbi:putative carboxypeptidase X1 [Glandiceps talaboti]